jgi:hypothetical protein
MTRHEIMLILERYDVDPKTHNIIADKILALSGGVGQSEQLIDLIEKAQTPKGNGVVDWLMKEYENSKIN